VRGRGYRHDQVVDGFRGTAAETAHRREEHLKHGLRRAAQSRVLALVEARAEQHIK
jgi:hypothetical protein